MCELQYFFLEIQTAIINHFQSIPLMKENRIEFEYVQFIGDNKHFLIDMKGNPEN